MFGDNSHIDKVNFWPKDESYRRLLEAILNCKEINGSDDTTKFLQQEITRETVVREYHACRKEVVAAHAVVQQMVDANLELGGNLVAAINALRFYADPDNYRHAYAAAIINDKGSLAREALAAIDRSAEGE